MGCPLWLVSNELSATTVFLKLGTTCAAPGMRNVTDFPVVDVNCRSKSTVPIELTGGPDMPLTGWLSCFGKGLNVAGSTGEFGPMSITKLMFAPVSRIVSILGVLKNTLLSLVGVLAE